MMLDRWRSNPISFIETVLHDPETKQPFKLLPAERAFLEHAFKRDDEDRLCYPEQVYSGPKKSGKTTFAGIHTLATLLLFGGSYPEATICANDQEQSVGRVFTMIKRIIESSPC
jgi:phage terminase large subunit-like protein